jgi:hypothetical protein
MRIAAHLSVVLACFIIGSYLPTYLSRAIVAASILIMPEARTGYSIWQENEEEI